ncbi:MAG TPA: TetR/AcrR family transcriptional regulator [Solirubrobacterales bacterium]|nr:TetR/AcrR family transcriptional regulator [Solirubrobacterales bacterium]
MTELRLVAPEAEDGPFTAGVPLPRRLPPGRHGIPANLVKEHQRLRLLAGMAEALGEHGYANVTTTHISERANVSTGTFYKHFGNLWDCLLAAYVAAADRLCAEIEAACAASRDDDAFEAAGEGDALAAGIDAALAFFAAQPELGQLLSAQAPREASALCAARRILISRLAAMLRRTRGVDDAPQPPGLDERLIDATLAFVHTRLVAGDAGRLTELGSELVAILDRPRVAPGYAR